MGKFKVGDKVRCVNAAHAAEHLATGQEYIVLALNDSGTCVRANNGSSFVFDEDRFELVAEPKTNQWEMYGGLSPLPVAAAAVGLTLLFVYVGPMMPEDGAVVPLVGSVTPCQDNVTPKLGE